MKKKISLILLGTALAIITIAVVPGKKLKAANPPGKIEASLKSDRIILDYIKAETGEKKVLDSSDLFLLAEELDKLNVIMGR